MAIERELKYQLDEARYERLKTALGRQQKAKQQTNLYLDTPGRELCGAFGALRLRKEGEKLFLTYKRGKSQKGSFFEINELEVEVTQQLWNVLAGGQLPSEALEPLDRLRHDFPHVTELVALGEVQNLRLCFPLPTGDTAELDRTVFPNGSVDYELEVETETPDEVERHLESLGVPLTPQSKTKFRRFLDAVGL
jgi:uncharacterized protein YjbK